MASLLFIIPFIKIKNYYSIKGKKMTPKKITPDIYKALKDANAKYEKVNKTSSIDLVNEKNSEISNKLKEIVKKYGKNLLGKKLNDEELHIIKEYLNILSNVINRDMTMCKVFPQSKIKEILNLEKDLIGFFSRKADIDNLLNSSLNEDYFNTLYRGLRLDYSGSEFKLEDDYMGMLIINMPEFSLRTPIDEKVFDDFLTKRRIYVKAEEPYSGIGLVASKFCIPEFFISITNKSGGGKKEVYDSFPIWEFSAELKIVGHNKDIISLASYDAGDFECARDDKFIIYDKQKDLAKYNGWI